MRLVKKKQETLHFSSQVWEVLTGGYHGDSSINTCVEQCATVSGFSATIGAELGSINEKGRLKTQVVYQRFIWSVIPGSGARVLENGYLNSPCTTC